MHFFPIDYKKDFEFVRTVDNSFDPRFFKAIKAKQNPSEPAARRRNESEVDLARAAPSRKVKVADCKSATMCSLPPVVPVAMSR